MYIAHFDHKEKRKPHYLKEHVNEMIELIHAFNLNFDLYHMTEASVILHDVGKKSGAAQGYIQNPHGKRGSVKHAIGGAYILVRKKPEVSQKKNYLMELVANIVAGHHAGLYNHNKDFFDRIDDLPKYLNQIEQLAEEEIKQVIFLLDESPLDEKLEEAREERFRLYISILVRFVTSALVDADYLSTEAYFSKEKERMRLYDPPTFYDFQIALDEYIGKELNNHETLLEIKKQVQEEAFVAGKQEGSFFTLHAPTGTGKTIASLRFALEHAKNHHKRRVITALPLMNLTEEISSIYRNIFGDDHVIEDHSSTSLPDEYDADPIRLAAENYHRNFVVTTTVQLFESLFHHRPMKLRKLHRLANSIIILDEYHKLPLHVLEPILQHLDILQTYFNVTVLLMSATPFPLLDSKKIAEMNLHNEPIEITDYQRLFEKVPTRVKYGWLNQKLSLNDLAERLTNESAVLTIVNTRKEAQILHQLLTQKDHQFENVYYLSTTMCGAHREQIINEIRCKRNQKSPRNIAVISTSILEAGIDTSFPTVYRMIAPIDSIVQAGGRCNRYGEIPLGRVVIFQTIDQNHVETSYAAGIEHTQRLIKEKGTKDFMEPDSFLTYFRRLFKGRDLNEVDITHKTCFNFRDNSQAFRMIKDDRISVICAEFNGFKKEWLKENKSPAWWREIQPFTVSVSPKSQEYEEVNGVRVWKGNYDDEYGIIL